MATSLVPPASRAGCVVPLFMSSVSTTCYLPLLPVSQSQPLTDLERPQNLSRESIESYRIPSILDFARTRLHTGSAAPNTYFVGRALKDSGEFEYDFIKVVNTTSSAATAAFQLGAAECKVAMDGLRTSQMVAYMRALAGHALRGHKQYL